MLTQKTNRILIVVLLMLSFACGLPTPGPHVGPDSFNTMVAQTSLALPTFPPAMTAPPSPSPTLSPPTAIPTPSGPSILLSAMLALPRYDSLDLDSKTISESALSINESAPNIDFIFHAPDPDQPDYQFLYPINNARIVYGGFEKADYDDCTNAFAKGPVFGSGLEQKAFPLDASIFVSAPGKYHCFVTSQGNVGAMVLSTLGDYIGMSYLNISYIIWDARLP